jgi:hypothetical protein
MRDAPKQKQLAMLLPSMTMVLCFLLLHLLLGWGSSGANASCWLPPMAWAQRIAPPWPLIDATRQTAPTEMLVQAGRTWFSWLADDDADPCLREALSLRLALADGSAVMACTVDWNATQAIANLSFVLANNTENCGTSNASNATATWLASGPWCSAPTAITTGELLVASTHLVLHALSVAGANGLFALSVAAVLVAWTILVALVSRPFCICMVRCCAACCVHFRRTMLPRPLVVQSIPSSELRVNLDSDEEADTTPMHDITAAVRRLPSASNGSYTGEQLI